MWVKKARGGADLIIVKPTFTSLLLCGLATAVAQTGHGLDVTLADRRRMKHQLGRAGQADRKPRCAHQDACNACKQPAEGDVRQCIWGCVMSSLSRELSINHTHEGCSGFTETPVKYGAK